MVGHLSYFLLVISMLMRDITWLRIFVILSALVAITYDAVWLKDPVGVFWETLLVIVNIAQIALIWWQNRRARFSPEETRLIAARLSVLDPHAARRLLDMGEWRNGAPGLVLTEQDKPVQHLTFIAQGSAEILCDGRTVAMCGPGNFVGEMSLVGNSPASAQAVLSENARLWQIDTDLVRSLRQSAPEMATALEAGIAQDLKSKILAANAAPQAIG